jgi:hypothetical protein
LPEIPSPPLDWFERMPRRWFSAVLVPADGTPPRRESTLISLDTPERSVLFRFLGHGAATRVEFRPVNCRFDPSLDVPAEAYRALSDSR